MLGRVELVAPTPTRCTCTHIRISHRGAAKCLLCPCELFEVPTCLCGHAHPGTECHRWCGCRTHEHVRAR